MEVAATSFSDNQKQSKQQEEARARYALVALASLYTFFYIGALLGWGPMQRMLESAGAFHELCSDDTITAATNMEDDDDGVCQAQAQTVINLGFLTTTLSILTPLMGTAIDLYGAPTVAYGMTFCALAGSGLVVIAASTHISSSLYWLAFGLLGLTTFTGSLMSVQTGLYFCGQTQVRIIMLLNSLFDAGSVSYLFLWMLQISTAWSFGWIALVYFLLGALLYLPACYYWTVAVPEEEEDDEQEVAPLSSNSNNDHEATPLKKDDNNDDDAVSESTASVRQSLHLYQHSHMITSLQRSSIITSTHQRHYHIPTTIYSSIVEQQESSSNSNSNKNKDHVLVADRSPKEQLLSWPFIMLNLFFAISQISCNWSLITAADFLASLGDDDGFYLKLFTLMQPASVLALPVVDAVVIHYGFGAAFQAVNGINFVYILIKCTSSSLHWQVITFLAVAVVRCFLYATVFSFLPSLLSQDVAGRGTGFLAMVGGLASFINIPLNALTTGGDFLTPNLLYLVAVVPCTAAAWYLQRVIETERQIKETSG